MKIGLLTAKSREAVERTATAVVTDRLFDIFLLIIIFCIAGGATLSMSLNLHHINMLAASMLCLLVIAAFCLWKSDKLLSKFLSSEFLSRIPSIKRIFIGLHDLIDILHRRDRQMIIISASIMLCITELGTILALLNAFPFSVEIPIQAAPQVALMIMLSFAIPLLPAGLGMHQAACLLALASYHAPVEEALGFSLLSQCGHWLLVLLTGLLATVLSHLRNDP